ncbi:hypothetical protein [Megamonas hypermegale]|nr:hypothetical protein [Megamonas hypermegale]
MSLLSIAVKAVGFFAKHKKVRDVAIKVAKNPTVRKVAIEAAKKAIKK